MISTIRGARRKRGGRGSGGDVPCGGAKPRELCARWSGGGEAEGEEEGDGSGEAALEGFEGI